MRRDLDKERALMLKLTEHLEAAQAITDELGYETAGYLVERALDEVRSIQWPETDPNIENFRTRRR